MAGNSNVNRTNTGKVNPGTTGSGTASAGKKKRRRLKRTVRRTFGALFMASAIAVAAIPTEGLRAEAPAEHTGASITVDPFENGVPRLPANATIYSYYLEGTGVTFRFAYVSKEGREDGDTRYAVIVGYEQVGNLQGGTLEIPETMEAYRKFSVTATDSGSAAVNMDNNFLYYVRNEIKEENGQKVQKVDEDGKPVFDAQNNPVYEREDIYRPCYYETRSTWINDKTLYEQDGTGTDGKPKYKVSEKERISKALVAYIGSQYLSSSTNNAGEYVLSNMDTTPVNGVDYADEVESLSQGVFKNCTNVTTLVLPGSIAGIGKYAFANGGFATVRFGNGLTCVADHAFDGCGSLTQVQFDKSCGLINLGAYAFANCAALPSLDLPGHVEKIGDGAFEGCTELTTVDMIHPDYVNSRGETVPLTGALKAMGRSVFRNCTKLRYIEFPTTYDGEVDVSQFQGCTSLEYIRSGYKGNEADGNSDFNLKEGDLPSFGWTEFLEQCPKNEDGTDTIFYLWGVKDGELHKTSTEQKIAYKFYDPQLKMYVYEKVVPELNDEGVATGRTTVYWVNDNNELVKCTIDPEIKNLVLPESIGPKNINSINSTTFQNKCNLESITIPASVRSIADSAFKGCHHLKWVIFTAADRIQSIGAGAFDTQAAASHIDGESDEDKALKSEWYLTLAGVIAPSSVPFQYAMSNPKTGTVNKTLLSYSSGFSTDYTPHLMVRRNEKTGLNELIDYPTYNDLKNNRFSAQNGYAYMTTENERETSEAIANNGGTLYREEILAVIRNLVLPDGIDSVAMVKVERGSDGKTAATLVDDVPGADRVALEEKDKGLEGDMVLLGSEGSDIISLFTYKEGNACTDLMKDRGFAKWEPAATGSTTDNEQAHTGLRKTLTTENVRLFEPGAFRNCDAFESISLNGGLKAVGHYAFADCDNLTDVSMAESLSALGRVPFLGSKKVANVNFNGSKKFSCDRSIIYELDGNGKKDRLVEYLYTRDEQPIEAWEVEDVSEIGPEAFRQTEIKRVDFSTSSVKLVPKYAFKETASLREVKLPPDYCKEICDHAFTDSGIEDLYVPGSVDKIGPDAFGNEEGGKYEGLTKLDNLDIYAPKDSSAERYTEGTPIGYHEKSDPVFIWIRFRGWKDGRDNVLLASYRAEAGSDATYPGEEPFKPNHTFEGWDPSLTGVQANDGNDGFDTYAQYKELTGPSYTVKFLDHDGTVLKEETVPAGGDATPPYERPTWSGHKFLDEYLPSYKNVRADVNAIAQYEPLTYGENSHKVTFYDDDGGTLGTVTVLEGEDAYFKNPEKAGYIFTGWVPNPVSVKMDMNVVAQYKADTSGSGDGSGSGSGSGSGDGSGSNGTLYTLTVQNGSGSGSYAAGSQPIIIANDPTSTQEFDHWTIDPENATIASKTLSATVITMPEGNVTVTAHYRTKDNSGTGSGDGSGDNPNRPTGTARPGGGTTVVIDKNGLSNTGVVNVVVHGSSDNFTIRIAENAAATEAVLKALIAEYGNNLENIKYFPMDISLYDSTGTRLITDTTGLSIDITLPLPDSMRVYAGNNKVAGVVNNRLDKLSPKFTTINGVPCVTFRAEHFSPYVIYVDTSRLGQGSAADDTPKTGDGIHPKWFLSIGLACLSVVMFMKKDTRKKEKVAVKAKR